VGRRLVVLGIVIAIAAGIAPGAAAFRQKPALSAGLLPETIVYGSGQRLDLYLPAPHEAPTGAVVFVHGGGWSSGNRTWYRAQGRRAAARGWVAASIDYRLAPAHPFPAALDDVRAAVAWVRAHAPELGVDRNRIALVGGSAGGNLVLLAGTTGVSGVRGIVAWSPPTDLTALRGRTLTALVRDYLGCSAASCAATARAASPLAQLRSGAPPMLVANSTHEMIPLAQATAFAQRARQHGVDVDLRVIAGTAHSTQYGAAIWPATIRFLERTIGPPATA
jgi:acetyl esterase/lipase